MPEMMGMGGGSKKAVNMQGINQKKKNTPRKGATMAKGRDPKSSTKEGETSRKIVDYLNKKANKVRMLLTWKGKTNNAT